MDGIQILKQEGEFMLFQNMIGSAEGILLIQLHEKGTNDKIHAYMDWMIPWQYPTSGMAKAKALRTDFNGS